MAKNSKGVWVEILRTGKWIDSAGQEVTITDQDLSEIEQNHNELIAGKFRAPLRLGSHREGIAPAVGWAGPVKKHGDRLSALFTDLVPAAAKAINARLYRSVSAGLRYGWEFGGKTYGKVLHHVAILGANLPAITGLEDIPALFGDDDNGQLVVVEMENDDAGLDLEKETADMDEITKLKAELAEKETVITGLRADLDAANTKAAADLNEAKAASDTKIAELTAKVAEFEGGAAKAEVTQIVENAAKEGRLAPAMKDQQIKIGLTMRAAEFAEGEDSPFDTWKDSLLKAPKSVKFEEKAENGADDADGDDTDETTKDFQEGQQIGRKYQGLDK